MARIKAEVIRNADATKKKIKVDKDAVVETEKERKKRRKLKKSRARAMRKEMRRLQSTDKYMVPKATMQRLIRSIANEISPGSSPRWTVEAIEQVQSAAEAYMHSLFTSAYQLTTRVGGRQTIRPEELRCVAAQHEDAKERFSAIAD